MANHIITLHFSAWVILPVTLKYDSNLVINNISSTVVQAAGGRAKKNR